MNSSASGRVMLLIIMVEAFSRAYSNQIRLTIFLLTGVKTEIPWYRKWKKWNGQSFIWNIYERCISPPTKCQEVYTPYLYVKPPGVLMVHCCVHNNYNSKWEELCTSQTLSSVHLFPSIALSVRPSINIWWRYSLLKRKQGHINSYNVNILFINDVNFLLPQ